jgi:hypothetical protein
MVGGLAPKRGAWWEHQAANYCLIWEGRSGKRLRRSHPKSANAADRRMTAIAFQLRKRKRNDWPLSHARSDGSPLPIMRGTRQIGTR